MEVGLKHQKVVGNLFPREDSMPDSSGGAAAVVDGAVHLNPGLQYASDADVGMACLDDQAHVHVKNLVGAQDEPHQEQ